MFEKVVRMLWPLWLWLAFVMAIAVVAKIA